MLENCPGFPNRESTLDLVCTALFYLSDSLALQLVNQAVIRQRPVSWWAYLQTTWITIRESLARLYQTSADEPQRVILSMSFCSLPSKDLSTSLNFNCDCQAAKARAINSWKFDELSRIARAPRHFNNMNRISPLWWQWLGPLTSKFNSRRHIQLASGLANASVGVLLRMYNGYR